MSTPLEGKVAIVTGAGSRIGFGRSMTLALVQAGARVAMMDVDSETLEQTANEVEETSGGGRGRVVQVVGDVSIAEDAERAVKVAINELGGPHPAYGSSKAGHEAFMASIAQQLEGTGVTVNVLVPGGPANTNLLPRDTPLDRAALIQPDVMQRPVVWLASAASDSVHGRRLIAYHWDETLSVEDRLNKAAAPLAWQQLGRQAIYPGR